MIIVSMLQNMGCPENIILMYTDFTIPITLVLVALLGLIAFFGYRIFKYAVRLIAAVAFAVLGNFFVLDFVRDFISPMLPESFSVAAISGILFALIGLILSICCYNFVMFLIGGGLSYMFASSILAGIGTLIEVPAILLEGIGFTVVSILIALVVGLLFMCCFKLIYIILTSIGSIAIAFALILLAVVPSADTTITGIALGIGAAVGLIAMFLQLKADAKIRLIRL
jgi:hypothetical protein